MNLKYKLSFAFWFLLFVILPLHSCKPEKENESTSKHLFSQSTRGAPTKEELKMFAKLGGCATYRLETTSTANPYIFSSANHCVKYDPKIWCRNRGNAIYSSSGIKLGECKEILIFNAKSDKIIFSVHNVNKAAIDQITPLRWGGFLPSQGQQLIALGYPGDKYRKGNPTATRNCKVQVQNVESWNDERVLAYARYPSSSSIPQKVKDTFEKPHYNLTDKRFAINCSIYGGNSGGPLLLKGTDIVVGQPSTYVSLDDMQKANISAYSEHDTTVGRGNHGYYFYLNNKELFKKHGINVAFSPNQPKNQVVRESITSETTTSDRTNKERTIILTNGSKSTCSLYKVSAPNAARVYSKTGQLLGTVGRDIRVVNQFEDLGSRVHVKVGPGSTFHREKVMVEESDLSCMDKKTSDG